MPKFEQYAIIENPAPEDVVLIMDVSDKIDSAAGTTKQTTVAGLGGASVPDATTTVKGKIKLAGDLGGTADLPTVPGLETKADLVDGIVPLEQLPDLLALGETSTTAYRGDRGKAAYDHSQLTSGNPHGVTKSDVGLGSVPNTDCTNAANITTGVLDIARIPPAAIERLYKYTGAQTAPENMGLTTGQVQNGDTVKVVNVGNASNGLMWLVTNDANLNLAASFEAYTTDTASSVPWSGITSKPANVTEIASAAFANDDIVQKKGGVLTNRTLAQLSADLAIPPTSVGLHTDIIDASALIEMASSAPGFTAGTGTTAFTLDFDSAAEEAAVVRWFPPQAWNAGTIQVRINFTQATTAAGGVAFRVDASAISDGEAFATPTYGTSQVVTKTAGTASTRYRTAATAAITVGSSPAKGDFVLLRLTREVANAADTLAQDAKVLSIEVSYTTDAGTDA